MPASEIDAERLFEGYEELETFRVQNILLVSSLYDSFILREDGGSTSSDRRIPRAQYALRARRDACSSGAEALALAAPSRAST